MMQGKRLLAILLCLAMCVSLFPAQALAESPEESEEDSAEVSLTDDIYEEEPESLFSFPEEMDEPVLEEETELPESEMLPEAEEPDVETSEDSEFVTEDPDTPVNTDEDGKEEPDPETADDAQEPEEVFEDEPAEEQEEELTEEPIDEEPADEEPVPVQVHFILNPEDAQLMVYERIEEEITALQPEEDRSWLLLPREFSTVPLQKGIGLLRKLHLQLPMLLHLP